MSEETPDILPDVPKVDTIGQHLSEISPLLTEGDIRVVLRRRKLAYDTPYDDLTEREFDYLCHRLVCEYLSKQCASTVVEGYTEKWGEKVLTKSTIRVHARGMRVWRRR